MSRHHSLSQIKPEAMAFFHILLHLTSLLVLKINGEAREMPQSAKHFPTQEDMSTDAQPQVQLGGSGYKDHSSRSSGAHQSPPVGELWERP